MYIPSFYLDFFVLATPEEVKSFFDGIELAEGDLDTIIFMCKDGTTAKATGDAFIRFASEEAVTAALALDGQHMGHRYIDVLKSNDTERQAHTHKHAAAHRPT